MRTLFVFVCLTCSSLTFAQQFRHVYTITLPDSIVKAQPARVDVNNDGLLDILLITEATSGRSYLQVVKGDTTITPFLVWQSTRLRGPLKAFAITDYDHDNRMDVVISTTTGRVGVYLNKGDFTFLGNALSLPAFSRLLITDLDEDGNAEWVMSNTADTNDKVRVYRQTGSFAWQMINDSIKVRATSLERTDQNGDGRPDLFVSGRVSSDSVLSAVFQNDSRNSLKLRSGSDFVGVSSSADVNDDGAFDFVVMGQNRSGTIGTRLIRSTGSNHQAETMSLVLSDASPYLADLNSDGIVDYNYFGRKGSDTLNIIQYASSNFDTIDSRGYRAHVFGDEDRDGDLDLVVVTRGFRTQLLGYTNMTHENKAPSTPQKPLVIPVFNRTFFYWEPSTDDHTPARSLTYDLYLDGTRVSAAEFDLLNDKRLTVTHGNNGTHHFKLLRRVSTSQFAVQAIDNSFHASKPCIGSGSLNCVTNRANQLALCANETTTLQAVNEVMWFSFLNGYLGKMRSLPVTAAADTLFYFDPTAKGCDVIKVYTVALSSNAIRNTYERFACSGQTLNLSVEPEWNSVSWRSHLRGPLSTATTISYVTTQTDTVTATMVTAQCTRRDRYVIRISAPVLRVTPDQVRIARGDRVQLTATGAERYEWAPVVGLSATNAPNPEASPEITTTYTVTGYDSLSCTATSQVTVVVETGGFIPNLFTPNDDGKNDEIRIYGVTAARNFQFTIHNREGSVVYRSDKLQDVIQKGWDGTRQGTRQPAGVYFWKVKGELSSGERLLLNGKESGSIVLVR